MGERSESSSKLVRRAVRNLSTLPSVLDHTLEDRTIHLRGESEALSLSFGLVFCRILRARKFYPDETFAESSKFGVSVDVPKDSDLVLYVSQLTKKVKGEGQFDFFLTKELIN